MRDMQPRKDTMHEALDGISLPQQRYIEVIGALERERGEARVTEVAGRLSVSLPSASEALKRLVKMGLATREAKSGIKLSNTGKRLEEQLDRRHKTLRRFMVDVMMMEPGKADRIACRMEHVMEREFTDRLLDLARFLEEEYPWTLKGIAQHVRSRNAARRDAVEFRGGI